MTAYISTVRADFLALIKEIIPTAKEWKDAFNFENIPSTIFNNSVHISYSVDSVEKGQTTITDSINVVVRLFFSGNRNPQEALDSAMDTSHLVRLNCISISNKPEGYLSIDSVSIIPEALDTNDNKMIVTLTFNAKKYFTNC